MNVPVATAMGTAPTARAHATSCGVSPTTKIDSGGHRLQPAPLRPLERKRHQRIPIRGIVAKRAAPEVAPQIEVLELDAGAPLEVAREQREKDVGARARACRAAAGSPGITAFTPSPGSAIASARCRRTRPAAARTGHRPARDRCPECVMQDDPVGPAGDGNAVERADDGRSPPRRRGSSRGSRRGR